LPIRLGEGLPVKIELWRDKLELVQAPTVYDLAHESGLTTAQVDWVAIQNAPTISWAFPEIPNPRGVIEQEMVAAGLITADEVVKFDELNPPWHDHYWTEAAVHLIRKHKPNLLLFHLLITDSLNHKYGPSSAASLAGYVYADACVRKVMEAVEAAGLKSRTTMLIVSDHGFKTVTHTIQPNVILKNEGLLKIDSEHLVCDAYVVPEGGTAMVYVTRKDQRMSLVPKLKELFMKVEGIDRILDERDFQAFGLPSPDKNRRMGDLVLCAKDGYGFSKDHEGLAVSKIETGTAGTHGYLSTDPDMNATFLAWGYGIRSDVKLGIIRNLDVAPTMALLLGLKMSDIDGHALKQILSSN
jgi:predicted AlkP superfamily pyrophosphatase or phosphodiesterase